MPGNPDATGKACCHWHCLSGGWCTHMWGNRVEARVAAVYAVNTVGKWLTHNQANKSWVSQGRIRFSRSVF